MEMASKQEIIGTMQHSTGLRHVNIKVAKKSDTVGCVHRSEWALPLHVSDYYTSVTETQKAVKGPRFWAEGAGAWEAVKICRRM